MHWKRLASTPRPCLSVLREGSRGAATQLLCLTAVMNAATDPETLPWCPLCFISLLAPKVLVKGASGGEFKKRGVYLRAIEVLYRVVHRVYKASIKKGSIGNSTPGRGTVEVYIFIYMHIFVCLSTYVMGAVSYFIIPRLCMKPASGRGGVLP